MELPNSQCRGVEVSKYYETPEMDSQVAYLPNRCVFVAGPPKANNAYPFSFP